jgi:two-component system sensor histidine kinase GlrK
MKLRRPRSLNGLILVGFGIVALPLLVAVVWALFNLDRLATQSEDIITMGVESAARNRLLAEDVVQLQRSTNQYYVLRNDESRTIMRQDLQRIEQLLYTMANLTDQANASEEAAMIGREARSIVDVVSEPDVSNADAEAAIERFGPLRTSVGELTIQLKTFVDRRLSDLQDSTTRAQQISAWQVATLVPGTLLLVLFFTLRIGRPIRQIDDAIHQLGQSGFSRQIEVQGPTDLEQLGRQLEWLRIRLLELAQEKNRFLRHMSHELKTPLANIREGTELLLDGTVGELGEPQREVTDILRMNGLKLQRLIENLLSFSAWQAKSEVLNLSDFPLRGLIMSVAKEQRLALKAAGIQLRLEVEDVVVNADQEKLRTVLDNLLSNAVKFTPRDGMVTIRAVREASSFVIDFADTGPGIPDEERSRIFEAFFQGRREQGGHVAGTGIGLSVVLECVQAHDGSVEIVDNGKFPGAHFRIHIPQNQIAAQRKLAANE